MQKNVLPGAVEKVFTCAAVAALLLSVLLLPVLIISGRSAYFAGAFSRHSQAITAMGTDPERDFAYFEQVLAVMHGYGSDLDPAYYSVEDQLHMRDVAELTASAKLVTATSVLLICIYFVRLPSGKRLQQLRRISSVALGITIASAAAVVLLFEPLFIMFHKVFFSTNTFWQLDPATSRLIRFLPQDLFAELVLISVTLSALILCAMFVFAIILERWQKKQ